MPDRTKSTLARREPLMLAGSVAFALTLLASHALAQAYPTRTVTVVVPFAAGGATHVVARLVAEKLGERLHSSFVMENKAWGGWKHRRQSRHRRSGRWLYYSVRYGWHASGQPVL